MRCGSPMKRTCCWVDGSVANAMVCAEVSRRRRNPCTARIRSLRWAMSSPRCTTAVDERKVAKARPSPITSNMVASSTSIRVKPRATLPGIFMAALRTG